MSLYAVGRRWTPLRDMARAQFERGGRENGRGVPIGIGCEHAIGAYAVAVADLVAGSREVEVETATNRRPRSSCPPWRRGRVVLPSPSRCGLFNPPSRRNSDVSCLRTVALVTVPQVL
jgi:hypothetical protein